MLEIGHFVKPETTAATTTIQKLKTNVYDLMDRKDGRVGDDEITRALFIVKAKVRPCQTQNEEGKVSGMQIYVRCVP